MQAARGRSSVEGRRELRGTAMSGYAWAIIVVAVVAIGVWWVWRAVSGVKRTARLGAAMLEEGRRRAKEHDTAPRDQKIH